MNIAPGPVNPSIRLIIVICGDWHPIVEATQHDPITREHEIAGITPETQNRIQVSTCDVSRILVQAGDYLAHDKFLCSLVRRRP